MRKATHQAQPRLNLVQVPLNPSMGIPEQDFFKQVRAYRLEVLVVAPKAAADPRVPYLNLLPVLRTAVDAIDRFPISHHEIKDVILAISQVASPDLVGNPAALQFVASTPIVMPEGAY